MHAFIDAKLNKVIENKINSDAIEVFDGMYPAEMSGS